MKTFFTLPAAVKLAFCSLLLILGFGANAQFVTTVPPLAGTNNQSGITFNVKAINSINITEIWASFLTGTYTVSVWYNTDSINGAPTINATNGWVQACTNVPLVVVGGGLGIIQQIPFAFNIPVAAGDVYGFYVEATNMPNAACIYYTNYVAPAQYIWGNADMYINTGNGNVGFGGPSPNPSFASRMFNGKVVYLPGVPPPCTTKVSNIVKSNVSLHGGTVSWDPVSNAVAYEYLVDKDPNTPTSSGYTYTSATSFNLTNLNDGECYYIHIRSVCNIPNDVSDWVLDSICTVPDCYVPQVIIDNVTSTTAIARWDAVPGAYGYEYSVGTTPNPPTNGAHTTYTSVKLQGLTPNKTLYFYIRAKCSPTPLSEWAVSSFHTAAALGIDDAIAGSFILNAYPNPVKNTLRLEMAAARNGIARIYITDLAGKLVKDIQMEKNRADVDVSNLVQGMYLLHYQDDTNTQVIKLLKE